MPSDLNIGSSERNELFQKRSTNYIGPDESLLEDPIYSVAKPLTMDEILTTGRYSTLYAEYQGEFTEQEVLNAIQTIVNHCPDLARILNYGNDELLYFAPNFDKSKGVKVVCIDDSSVDAKALFENEYNRYEGNVDTSLLKIFYVKGNPSKFMFFADHFLLDGVGHDVLLSVLLHLLEYPNDLSVLDNLPRSVMHPSNELYKPGKTPAVAKFIADRIMQMNNPESMDLYRELSNLSYKLFEVYLSPEEVTAIKLKCKIEGVSFNDFFVAAVLKTYSNVGLLNPGYQMVGQVVDSRSSLGIHKNALGDNKDLDIRILLSDISKKDVWTLAKNLRNTFLNSKNFGISITRQLAKVAYPGFKTESVQAVNVTGAMAMTMVSNLGVVGRRFSDSESMQEISQKLGQTFFAVQHTPIAPLPIIGTAGSIRGGTTITTAVQDDFEGDILSANDIEEFCNEIKRLFTESMKENFEA